MSVASHTNEPAIANIPEYRLNVHAAGKTYSLDFRQGFRFGYTLLKTAQFKEASRVFEALMRSGDDAPMLSVMLAYCQAGLRDYGRSKALLSAAFPEGGRDKAERLHTAFVYLSVGMWADAVEGLQQGGAPVPQPAGDVSAAGRRAGDPGATRKAILCWRLAAARDRRSGAVAATARYLISTHTKPPAKA